MLTLKYRRYSHFVLCQEHNGNRKALRRVNDALVWTDEVAAGTIERTYEEQNEKTKKHETKGNETRSKWGVPGGKTRVSRYSYFEVVLHTYVHSIRMPVSFLILFFQDTYTTACWGRYSPLRLGGLHLECHRFAAVVRQMQHALAHKPANQKATRVPGWKRGRAAAAVRKRTGKGGGG